MREDLGDSTVIISDVCLDEFTDHGHCGVLDSRGRVHNDDTLAIYREMAVRQAEAGAHMLGLSGMMGGQVSACRSALAEAGYTDVAILLYAAKYAPVYDGPFREAVDSQLRGDRSTYQLDPPNRREGVSEAELDIAQGADVVMVKPDGSYPDVLSDVCAISPAPVAAYQVSGEYSMAEAAAARGWIDRDRVIDESVTAIARAGATMICTYWASELAGRMTNG